MLVRADLMLTVNCDRCNVKLWYQRMCINLVHYVCWSTKRTVTSGLSAGEECSYVKEIKVSSVILSARSRFFHHMTTSGLRESLASNPFMLKIGPEGEQSVQTTVLFWKFSKIAVLISSMQAHWDRFPSHHKPSDTQFDYSRTGRLFFLNCINDNWSWVKIKLRREWVSLFLTCCAFQMFRLNGNKWEVQGKLASTWMEPTHASRCTISLDAGAACSVLRDQLPTIPARKGTSMILSC